MLVPNDHLQDVMKALKDMGASWGPRNTNEGHPTFKGMFRQSIIAVYESDPISEMICLNPKFSPDFEKMIEAMFEVPEDDLTSPEG